MEVVSGMSIVLLSLPTLRDTKTSRKGREEFYHGKRKNPLSLLLLQQWLVNVILSNFTDPKIKTRSSAPIARDRHLSR